MHVPTRYALPYSPGAKSRERGVRGENQAFDGSLLALGVRGQRPRIQNKILGSKGGEAPDACL